MDSIRHRRLRFESAFTFPERAARFQREQDRSKEPLSWVIRSDLKPAPRRTGPLGYAPGTNIACTFLFRARDVPSSATSPRKGLIGRGSRTRSFRPAKRAVGVTFAACPAFQRSTPVRRPRGCPNRACQISAVFLCSWLWRVPAACTC